MEREIVQKQPINVRNIVEKRAVIREIPRTLPPGYGYYENIVLMKTRLNAAMIAECAIPYTTRHSVHVECLNTPTQQHRALVFTLHTRSHRCFRACCLVQTRFYCCGTSLGLEACLNGELLARRSSSLWQQHCVIIPHPPFTQ